MSKPSSKKTRRTSRYHHGDLRNALIEAALELVRRDGVTALGLRAVARKVGVSHMAPYNHFDDREALVAAVAARGFGVLRGEIVRRMAEFPDRPARQLQECGVAYVGFAIANPELFRLMFSPELADKSRHPELALAAQEAFGTLAEVSDRSGATGGRKEPELAPLVGWSLVHGLAVLLLDQQLGPPVGVREAEEIARAATDMFWVGLSAGPAPTKKGGPD